MGAIERRQAVIEALCKRRHDTTENLAHEFNVSTRTMRNDIDILSLDYPLETVRGRYGGGVQLPEGFHLNRKYLKPSQKNLLERLSIELKGTDLDVMRTILRDFSLPNMKG